LVNVLSSPPSTSTNVVTPAVNPEPNVPGKAKGKSGKGNRDIWSTQGKSSSNVVPWVIGGLSIFGALLATLGIVQKQKNSAERTPLLV